MAHKERTPALAGVRGSGEIVAGSFDAPEYSNPPLHLQLRRLAALGVTGPLALSIAALAWPAAGGAA